MPEFLSPYDQYLSDEDGGTPGSGISNSVDEVDRNARSADAGIVAQDTDEGSMHPPVDEVAFNIENADPEISEVRSPKKVPPTESNVSGRQYQVAELTATAGPHAGGSWIVQKGDREKYCIGRDPKRKGYLPIKLPDDKCIQGTHSYLKLELSKSKLCIRLWDLSNGKIETSGTRKDVGIYILSDKDFIAMGGTRLVVSHVPCRSLN